MKLRTKIFAFGAAGVSIVGLVALVLVLTADTSLAKAAKNCDTISIDASYNTATKSLAASQSVFYKNRTEQPLAQVKFHIYANAYRDGAENPPVTPNEVPQAYPNGKNFGGITIHSVSAGGKTVSPVIEGDATVLSVPIEGTLGAGQTARIDIDYTVKLANIKHRLGWTDAAVNLGNFYPVPCVFENGRWQTYPYSASGDPFYNALHNFDVSITTPRDFALAASGETVKFTENSATRTTKLRARAIRDFAAVLSRGFKTQTARSGKTTVKYYYLNDAEPQKSLETAVKSLKTFSDLFTKYPYANLSVVQTDFLHGGMEYGELVYVSRDLLSCAEHKHAGGKCDRTDHDRVIIHEIAHQWWYGIVGNNQTRTAWIDEGLAEYSTLLFYDNHPEYNVDRKVLIENARVNFSTYVKLVRGVGGILDVSMDRDLASFNSSYEYVFMTYVRGLLLFCDLENILTRPALTRALGDFARVTQFGMGTQKQLVAAIENAANARVELFFETYLSGY